MRGRVGVRGVWGECEGGGERGGRGSMRDGGGSQMGGE